jgi:hypothetical protein
LDTASKYSPFARYQYGGKSGPPAKGRQYENDPGMLCCEAGEGANLNDKKMNPCVNTQFLDLTGGDNLGRQVFYGYYNGFYRDKDLEEGDNLSTDNRNVGWDGRR